MSVTAARLGSSPIGLDWSGLQASPRATERLPSWVAAWAKLKERIQSGEVGFYETPVQASLSQLEACESLAAELRGKFSDCLFLGIGGSSLGPLSLLSALREKTQSGMNIHILENPDPIEWRTTLSALEPSRTLVVCVTKSGTTFETLAQFQLALAWLGQDRWKEQVIAITDPVKGDLRAMAKHYGIRTLEIAPSLGGRFSIFSPVGLFPALLAGLNAKEFMQGASQVRDFMEKTQPEKNPLFIVGSELLQQYERRKIHVCMPYSTPLRSFGDWFVQLWAESLGKDGKGFTPLGALGATDQHSILQLLRDGPDDKVTWFMTVDKMGEAIRVPKRQAELARFPAFELLSGHSLDELLTVEYRAIALTLTKRGRAHLTWKLDQLDERNLGAAYFAFSVLTAFTGTLWGVDPFDQPGVEEGKIYIREALKGATAERGAREDEDSNSPVARLRRNTED